MTVDAGVTETNTATVSGYAGITNDISAYTLSGTLNLNQVYDSRKFYWRNTVGAPAPTRLGECAVFGSDITIAAPANNPASTAKYTEVKTTGSLILSVAGDYSATRWIRDSGTTTRVAAGTTNLSGWQFTGATIDNASASAAIILVDYDQIGNISTTSTGGGSISVRSTPVVFTGFPTAANANGRSPEATLGIQDVSSGIWHTYDASSGSVSVSLSQLATAPAYQLVVRADAIGWIRTPDSTIDADYSGTFNFANLFREIVDDDGDAMVGLGVQATMDKISYNQSAGRFEIDSGAIDFFSALDKKEVLTSSQAGLTVFDSALVRQLNFIKNAYANLIQFPNPLTAAASATAATSPILTDFVVMRTGDPTADVFVHGLSSSAPGLSDRPEIRMGTTKFISASASGGSGATAIEIRQEIDNNSSKLATIESQTSKLTFTNTGRVDATTITIANNAITAVAIDTDAITSSGLAASAVTEIQSGLATQSSLSAIPTNPLLTSDTRLNNLNAPIGSIPTNPLLTSDVRLNNLNAPVGSIPTNPLLSSDTRLNNLNAPIGSIPVNPLLTTDERLVNLDGKISDRPTLVQIEASATLAKSSQIPPAPDNSRDCCH
jgi:hypothetical protein